MARDFFPGFIFDVPAWRSSTAVRRMSFAERGVYFEMMLEQWDKRFLPDDPQAVADAIATTPEQVAEVLAAWATVRRKFVAATRGPKRIYNAKLERTRKRQRAKVLDRSEKAKRAGKASAAKRKQQQGIATNIRSTSVQRLSTVLSCSCSGVDCTAVKEQEQKNSAADAARLPAENLAVITKIAHEVLEVGTGEADQVDTIKGLCAQRRIAYDSTVVRKALESATVQRHRKAG